MTAWSKVSKVLDRSVEDVELLLLSASLVVMGVNSLAMPSWVTHHQQHMAHVVTTLVAVVSQNRVQWRLLRHAERTKNTWMAATTAFLSMYITMAVGALGSMIGTCSVRQALRGHGDFATHVGVAAFLFGMVPKSIYLCLWTLFGKRVDAGGMVGSHALASLVLVAVLALAKVCGEHVQPIAQLWLLRLRLWISKHVKRALGNNVHVRRLETAEQEAPPHLCCPITHTIFRHPVIAPSGFTYERSAILTHLRGSSIDPLTREPLAADQLRPNRAVRDAVDVYLEQQLNQDTDDEGVHEQGPGKLDVDE